MTAMILQNSSSKEQSKSFDLLADPIRRWIWRKGWFSLRDIQERAIPELIKGNRDVIIAAATAAGKTEAAFMPLLSRTLLAENNEGFDLVYIGPLRALINDQFQRLEDLCQTIDMPVHPWHGDISRGVKAQARKNPSGVLLITPESLEAMFVLRGAEVPYLFKGTQAIVIDELHALLDSERGIHMRSLLTRLEIAVGRRIRRIGLSATLGDMSLVNAYLRPESPDNIVQIISRSMHQRLHAQLRAYRSQQPVSKDQNGSGNDLSAQRSVSAHLFDKLRGTNNLIFPGPRRNVEIYSDILRRICEEQNLPNEFFPHHSSLSREHRELLEHHLRNSVLPLTVLCTTTLELGIDIGNIACIGQIGAPPSVAALRQRLGRSGRRAGQPVRLRMYAIEPETGPNSSLIDRFHLGLVRSIAMMELLLEGWCEPPRPNALHLSTLTHQILSVIAEHGGVSAQRLFITLCKRGPFRAIDSNLFARLLCRLGDPKIALIEQTSDGILLLGKEGERVVEHYSFYPVFQTPQEFRIIHDGKELGTVPIESPLTQNQAIIFTGRRWKVLEVCDLERVVEVTPDQAGAAPIFGGEAENIHDKVVERMRYILCQDSLPSYLDSVAKEVLTEARLAYRHCKLESTLLMQTGKSSYLLAHWTGTVRGLSLAVLFTASGFHVDVFDGLLGISSTGNSSQNPLSFLKEIADERIDMRSLLCGHIKNLATEKFHRYLDESLLLDDTFSYRLNMKAAIETAKKLQSAVMQ